MRLGVPSEFGRRARDGSDPGGAAARPRERRRDGGGGEKRARGGESPRRTRLATRRRRRGARARDGDGARPRRRRVRGRPAAGAGDARARVRRARGRNRTQKKTRFFFARRGPNARRRAFRTFRLRDADRPIFADLHLCGVPARGAARMRVVRRGAGTSGRLGGARAGRAGDQRARARAKPLRALVRPRRERDGEREGFRRSFRGSTRSERVTHACARRRARARRVLSYEESPRASRRRKTRRILRRRGVRGVLRAGRRVERGDRGAQLEAVVVRGHSVRLRYERRFRTTRSLRRDDRTVFDD